MTRYVVVQVDTGSTLPMTSYGTLDWSLPGAASGATSFKAWPISNAQVAAQQLDAVPYGSGWPSAVGQLGMFNVAAGASKAVEFLNNGGRLRNYIFDGSDSVSSLLVSLDSGSLNLCASKASCSLAADFPVEPVNFAGEQAVFRQPSLPLPMGGSLSINAANGLVHLKPFRGPDFGTSACLEVSPQFNSAEPTFSGSFGSGFESSAEQVRTWISPAGYLMGRGLTGWSRTIDSAARYWTTDATGSPISSGTATGGGAYTSVGDQMRRYRTLNPSGSQISRPYDCVDSADNVATTLAYPNGKLATIANSTRATTLTLGRDSVGRIVSQTGGLASTTFAYDSSGHLAGADLGAFGSVQITWSSVGGDSVPTKLEYDTGDVVNIAYEPTALGPAATRAEVRAKDDEVEMFLEFQGSGSSRVLHSPEGDVPTTATSFGRIINVDQSAPSFADPDAETDDITELPDQAPLEVVYDSATSKLKLMGTLSDASGGIARVDVKTTSGTTLASNTPLCSAPTGCPTSLVLDPLTYTSTLSDGQGLEVVARDGEGYVSTTPAVAHPAGAVPGPVEEVIVGNVDGTTTKTVAISWISPDEALPVQRTVRSRINGGSWSSAVDATGGELSLSGLQVGNTIDLEFNATDVFGRARPVQSQTLTVTSVAPNMQPATSNAEQAFRGNAANQLSLTVRSPDGNGGFTPVADTGVDYESSRIMVSPTDGKTYRVKHFGTVVTDASGNATVPELQDAELRLTAGGKEFDGGSGASSRSQTITLPAAEELPDLIAQQLGVGLPFLPTVPANPIDLIDKVLPKFGNPKEEEYCKASQVQARACVAVLESSKRVGGGGDAGKEAPGPVIGYWGYLQGARKDRDSTRQNGFKHGYWNGLIERMMRTQLNIPGLDKYNLKHVQTLMTLHEWYNERSKKLRIRRATTMDYFNNARGRAFARNKIKFSDIEFCRAYVAWSYHQTLAWFRPGSAQFTSEPPKKKLVYTQTGYRTRSDGSRYYVGSVIKKPTRQEDKCDTGLRRASNGYYQEEVSTGPRASLTWNAPTDVDLHIWDDQGNHASYSAKTAIPNALLSDDNTSGYGPETFAESLNPGRTYVYGVCLYSGSVSSRADVVLVDPNGGERKLSATLTPENPSAILGQSPGSGSLPTPSAGWCREGSSGGGDNGEPGAS